MQCQEFEDRLQEILDARERAAADHHLAAHAGECERCGQLLAGHEVLLATVSCLPTPSLTAGFSRRVLAAPAREVQPAPRLSLSRAWLAVGTLLAAAAAMLMAVSLVWYARRGEPVVIQQGPTEHVEGLSHERPRRPPMRGGSLAVSQSSWLIEAPRLPSEIGRNYRGTIDNLATSLPQTVQRLDEVERYAPGIKPLRLSFTVLIKALWRAIPGGEDEPSGKARTTQSPLDLPAIA
jgi:hypothetical protein